MTGPGRARLCDVALVDGWRHRLDATHWRLIGPGGAVYRLCSLGCVVSFCCEAVQSDRLEHAVGTTRSAAASGSAG
jgi:hypothetical protein